MLALPAALIPAGFAAVVAGARRSFDVLDFRTETGSAGLGIDATEAESMRNALARLVDAHRRTLDRLSTGVAMFDADQKLIFYNAAYRALVESRCLPARSAPDRFKPA